MHNIDKLDKGNRFPIINNQIRGNCFKYYKELTRQKHSENFFFNRTAKLWNALPNEVSQSPSVNSLQVAIAG